MVLLGTKMKNTLVIAFAIIVDVTLDSQSGMV